MLLPHTNAPQAQHGCLSKDLVSFPNWVVHWRSSEHFAVEAVHSTMAKFPNASQMKTINSCKSLNYSRPSAKRLKCAQPALAGNGQFLLFGKRAPSRIFSASDWMQAGQLIWNQFECFAAFLGVQVHSLFATLRTIYWRAVTIANASIFRIEARKSYNFAQNELAEKNGHG